jgi:hypothetical protein
MTTTFPGDSINRVSPSVMASFVLANWYDLRSLGPAAQNKTGDLFLSSWGDHESILLQSKKRRERFSMIRWISHSSDLLIRPLLSYPLRCRNIVQCIDGFLSKVYNT